MERDPAITQPQRYYLEAFDRHLRGDPRARADMILRLGPVLDEAVGAGRRSARRRRFVRAATP